jgi:hypothetical protein
LIRSKGKVYKTLSQSENWFGNLAGEKKKDPPKPKPKPAPPARPAPLVNPMTNPMMMMMAPMMQAYMATYQKQQAAAPLTAKGGPLAPPGSMPSQVPVNPIAIPIAGGGLNKLALNNALKPVMNASKNISNINSKMKN